MRSKFPTRNEVCDWSNQPNSSSPLALDTYWPLTVVANIGNQKT